MTVPVQLRPIPLCSEGPVWGEAELRKRHAENERSFDRGFRLRAYSDDEATFPSFKKCRQSGIVLGDIQRNDAWPAFVGVDLSSKKRAGNAISVIRVDPARRYRYPVDIRFIAKPGPEVCDAIAEVDALYKPVVVMVEDNGYQDTIMDWIGDQKARFPFWLKVEPTQTTSGRKGDAERGLPGLEVEFKNGAWAFPYSEYEGASRDEPGARGAWARLDYEFNFHPIASSDDGVMSVWFARQGIEQFGGFGVAGAASVGNLNVR